MKLIQLSVFIENRHGRIANVASILRDAKVNLLAISLAETQDYGILRMIVDDVEKAEATLIQHGMTCIKTAVVALAVDHKIGSLASALNLMDQFELNIEYLYTMSEKCTAIIFRFEDNDKALEQLKKAKMHLVTSAMLK